MSEQPLRFYNNDTMSLVQINNNNIGGTESLTNVQLEQILCVDLVNQVLPVDVSFVQPSSADISGNKSRLSGVMINNNEDYIDSELFAMTLKYVVNPSSNVDVSYPKPIFAPTYTINEGMTLYGETTSNMDSNIKVDIIYNAARQLSVVDGTSTAGDWGVYFDRSTYSGNFVAAINSDLNTVDNLYPMSISEQLSANKKCLFNDGYYISDISAATNEITPAYDASYTLASNNLLGTINVNHDYVINDFTMYKIDQPVPIVTETFDGTIDLSANLPIGDANGNNLSPPSLSDISNNMASVLSGTGYSVSEIHDGFSIDVYIADVESGGYSISPPTDVLSINDSNLVDSYSYFEYGYASGSHYIDISNGSVTLTGDISNVTLINLTDTSETLEYPYNTENGRIKIVVDEVTNRIQNTVSGNESGSSYNFVVGSKVIYNCDEALVYNDNICNKIDISLKESPEVGLYAGVVVDKTSDPNAYLFTDNSLNLLKAGDGSVLVISNDSIYNPTLPNYTDVSYVSNISTYYDVSQIIFLTIENQNILTEQTPLVNASGIDISNSLTKVVIQDVNLHDLSYSDYRVLFDTKTITDLSNSMAATNGWRLRSTDGRDFMTTNPLKTSILYDDCLFMVSPVVDLSFQYLLSIATPEVTNIQSIKHRIDISFTDVSSNGVVYSDEVSYAYLDDNDITYSDVSYVDISGGPITSGLSIVGTPPSVYGITTVDKFIFKQFTRTSTFHVSFDPKLPFYTNLDIYSPLVSETIVFYKMYDLSGNEQPNIYLKYIKRNSDNVLLSNVTVDFTSPPNGTILSVSQLDCSTLKATLLGKKPDGDYEPLPNTSTPDVDPFFNTETIITGINGYAGHAHITVQVTAPTILSSDFYTIDMVNAPGTNLSFVTELYTYDTTDHSISNNGFDNFSPYNSTWVDDVANGYWSGTPVNLTSVVLNNEVVQNVGGTFTLNIFAEGLTDILASITQPHNFINDFNIIRNINTLVYVEQTLMPTESVTQHYNIALPNGAYDIVNLVDGVYLDIEKLSIIRNSYSFELKSDQFSVDFVLDANYATAGYNNGWDTQYNLFTSITNVVQTSPNLLLQVDSGNVGTNQTKSVQFEYYRGYYRVVGGTDTITITRTSLTANFIVENMTGRAIQSFANFTAGSTYTVNYVVGTDTSFNIGLQIDGDLSLLSSLDPSHIIITVTGADVSYNFVNSACFIIDQFNIHGSGNLTDGSFPDLFGWLSRRIKSDYVHIRIEYNVPNTEIYNAALPYYSAINPKNYSSWINADSVIYENMIMGVEKSGVTITRTQNYVGSAYVSYMVIIPPQLKFTYLPASSLVTTLPFNIASYTQKNYYVSLLQADQFIIGSVNVYNDITPDGGSATDYVLTNNYIPLLYHYTEVTSTDKENFVIKGNKIRMGYYYGIAHDSYNEINNLALDWVYPGNDSFAPIDELVNSEGYFTVDLKPDRGYDISYSQYINSSIRTDKNIQFDISNAFIYSSDPIYLDLPAAVSTHVEIYQAQSNLVDNSFVLVIDKYSSIGVDYGYLISNNNLQKIFFIMDEHSTCTFEIDGSTITIGSQTIDINNLFDIATSEVVFVPDSSFNDAVDIGLTFSALSTTGTANLSTLFTYVFSDYLLSKSLYVNIPDCLNVTSLVGTKLFRLTNCGNIKTPSVTAYSFNIASNPDFSAP